MHSVPQPPEGAARKVLADGHADLLVREEPLLLVVHGQQLLTMRTPGNDDDLALGFLLGEGLIARADDVVGCELRPGDAEARTVDELHVTLRTPPGVSLGPSLGGARASSRNAPDPPSLLMPRSPSTISTFNAAATSITRWRVLSTLSRSSPVS